AIEVEDDLVEVVAADMHRQIAPPVVRIALQYDLPTRQHVGDAIGIAHYRHVETGVFDAALFPVMFWQYRHMADGQRQAATIITIEMEFHRQAIDLLDATDLLELDGVARVTFLFQGVEAEYHVIRGNG